MKVKDLINKLKELDEEAEVGYLEVEAYDNDGMSFSYEVSSIEDWYPVTNDIVNFDGCDYYLQ